mgnify:CR=1 FL=1
MFEYYINSSFTQKLREELPDHCTSYSAAASPASTLLPSHDELGPGADLEFRFSAHAWMFIDLPGVYLEYTFYYIVIILSNDDLVPVQCNVVGGRTV